MRTDYDQPVNSIPSRPTFYWVLAVGAVAAGLWWGGRASPEPLPPAFVDTIVTAPERITVHVGGWVARPGLVEVAAGARVADAIAAAGGVLPGGVTEAINLAASLTDGAQILVPSPDDSGASAPPHQSSSGPISLSRASADELDALPGIGPVIAQRIVDYRDANGPFESVEDLLDVPGIGEAKLADIRDLVVP